MSADLRYQNVIAFAESAKLPSEKPPHGLKLVFNGDATAMVKNRVKEFRLRDGLTQDGLGQKIGASYSTISRMENDVTELEVADLVKLAEVFGVQPLELITDVPVPTSEDEEALLHAVRNLTPEALTALIATAKAMPKKG